MTSPLREFDRRREEFRKTFRRAETAVRPILEAVRRQGDRAVLRYTKQFDRASLKTIRVSGKEFETAARQVKTADRLTLQSVVDRFRRFYSAQRVRGAPFVDTAGFFSERISPLDRVGLYVPGGRAPLVSTLLMLAVPAEVAGVRERWIATPPRPDGTVPPILLEAARAAGATGVFKMGGAQALAAFAFGTRTVPAVDKIFGPGNVYVTAAKKLLFGDVGVDLLAGPSELVVIADENAASPLVAEDMMAQAEHGPDSLALLLTTSAALAAAVKSEIARDRTARRQIFVVRMKSLSACVAAAAKIAPEHLSLAVAEPERLLASVGPAGAIFLGTTAVAYGDYVAGPNHTLPTSGAARFSSPLSIDSFFRRSSILSARDPGGDLARIGATLADWEGLSHHAASLRLRQKSR